MEKYKFPAKYDRLNIQIIEFLNTSKQKLAEIKARLNMYLKCSIRKKQNRQFVNNEKKFFKELKFE